ncbi:hypothetical protein B0A55_05738 [Friedmanniomyces simplex]|uniref:Uncharacterized protein n=1 Tax=Friedmanniomyces simplex TaxID=329884 RepID=A0A4U0X6C9_9PEZI|nr:hypothetical protein B0A55_05738 [Friedmanniomyces simplex]
MQPLILLASKAFESLLCSPLRSSALGMASAIGSESGPAPCPDANDSTITAVPTSAQPQPKCALDYLEALERFDAADWGECILKNLLLNLSAEENWYPAERRRLQAEDVYATAHRLTPAISSEDHVAMQDLRTSLDELAQIQQEAAPRLVQERSLLYSHAGELKELDEDEDVDMGYQYNGYEDGEELQSEKESVLKKRKRRYQLLTDALSRCHYPATTMATLEQ